MRKVFKTEGEVFLYSSNGHGAWEAALANIFSPGDKILVPETGNFSKAWANMAEALTLNVETLPGNWRRAIDINVLEEQLKKDNKGEIKGILIIHTETATGITNDLPAIRAAIDAAKHPALLVVDTVAAAGTVDYRMDEWGIDVTVGESQKGLMLPPGLGIVAAGEKAISASKKAAMPRLYWDWKTRLEAEHYRKFCGTAPQLMIFGMREALDMLFEEGLENVFERHRVLAGATQAAVEVWGQAGTLSLNATEPRERSNAVTTIRVSEDIDADELRNICRDEMMVALGGGLGDLNGKAFRIGHMGDINAPMLYAALSAVESTLGYLNIKYGSGGVTAAINHITETKKNQSGPFSY
jgi:alanine-glyoxylate transaminase/serine-glyoxylate transaminase/serine-pyruvate transaminase